MRVRVFVGFVVFRFPYKNSCLVGLGRSLAGDRSESVGIYI